MGISSSPTVQLRRLAGELRRLRQENRLTTTAVADEMSCSQAKISRLERGLITVKAKELDMLLDIYGVHDYYERERMLDMARGSSRRGWWHKYRDVISEHYSTYIGLENEATMLQTFQAQLIPGLFQTEAYARGIYEAAVPPRPPERFERQVSVRLARQARLFEANPIEVWAVMSEHVLQHVVGNMHVMREQLRWLQRLEELPNVNMQFLPRSFGAHPGMRGAFSILSFPELTDPDVIYTSTFAGELYLEDADDITRAKLSMDHLRARATGPRFTKTRLESAYEELDEL
jgi:transcriptional regulator with XRE-family HTH domain